MKLVCDQDTIYILIKVNFINILAVLLVAYIYIYMLNFMPIVYLLHIFKLIPQFVWVEMKMQHFFSYLMKELMGLSSLVEIEK